MNSEHVEVLREGWQVVGDGHEIAHIDLGTDVSLSLSGDFATNQERAQFAQALADRLNAAPAEAQPVGVEDIAVELEYYANCPGRILALAGKLRALAQQPSAVDIGQFRTAVATHQLACRKTVRDCREGKLPSGNIQIYLGELAEANRLLDLVDSAAQPGVAHATAAKDAELVELRSTIEALRVGVEDLSCCGSNDETPKSHCMDCSRYPGQPAQQSAAVDGVKCPWDGGSPCVEPMPAGMVYPKKPAPRAGGYLDTSGVEWNAWDAGQMEAYARAAYSDGWEAGYRAALRDHDQEVGNG